MASKGLAAAAKVGGTDVAAAEEKRLAADKSLSPVDMSAHCALVASKHAAALPTCDLLSSVM